MKNYVQGFYTGFIFVSVISIILFNARAAAQQTSWASNGPYGGHVNCVALSESNPEILYAGTDHGIYKTENGGDHWSRVNFPDYYKVTAIKVHSSNPDIVVAGTYQKGVYRSGNGGQSWKYMGFWDQAINTMATDPNNPDVIYFGTGEFLRNSVEEFIAIYKASDGWETGSSLKFWENWNVCGWSQVNKIVVDPDSSNWIYAAGINSGYCSTFGGVLISQDGGDTWIDKKIGISSTDQVSNIAVTINSLGERTIFAMYGFVYLSSDLKLFKSSDMGENWLEVDIPYSGKMNPDIFRVHPQDPGSLIIGSYDVDQPLWNYNSETDQWDYINGAGLPPAFSPACMEVSPGDESVYYLATLYGGIYKFDNNVNSWKKINAGINNSLVNDLIVNPNDCNTVYAATEEELELYRSADAGSSWELNQSNLSASFDVLAVDPDNSSTFYGAKSGLSYHVLYKGENNGQSWTGPIDFTECLGSPCYTEITDILVKPGNSDAILVSTQPYYLSSGLTGFGTVARTTDGGASWDRLITAPGSTMAIDLQDPDIVYIGKERAGQVFKVQDAWGNQVPTEITPDEGIENVQDIIVDNQSNLFVATIAGLWRRNGDGWVKLNCLADNITALAVDNSRNPAVVYAGSEGDGIFVSDDRGESWMVFNNGLGCLNISKLAVCDAMLYAGTEYGGVWSRVIPDTHSPSFLTHSTGNMEVSVFQNGCIGHAGPNWTYGDGLIFENNIDPLFTSGLILGTSARGYVNGQICSFGINNDFQNTSPISGFENIPGRWDQKTTSMFNDNSSPSPLGVQVVQQSYSNQGEDILFIRYTIKSSSGSLNDLYVGLFADWDVGGGDYHQQNLGGFDLPGNLAYQFLESADPDQNFYGIVALNGISGTRITGTGSQLYIRDSSFVWISTINDTEITESGEYRMWIGSGPFNVDAEEKLLVSFAIVAGSTLEEVQDNAELAAQRHQDLLTGMDEKEIRPGVFTLEQNRPNPFRQQTEICYTIAYESDVQLDLFDSQGVKVKSFIHKKQAAGNYSISINNEHLNPGIYYYCLRAGDFIQTKKMVLTR